MKAPIDNFWHQRFDQADYFYGKEPNDFLRSQVHHLPACGQVLSLGEGEGRNAVYLASLGYEVTAVDNAASGLEKIQRLAEEKQVKVNTVLADLSDYDLGTQQWDAIISVFCHLPLPVRQAVHKQIYTALKPNGIFLLEAYRPEQLEYKTGGPSNVELLYKASDIAAELAPLALDYIAEAQRYIHEGQGHQGQSAVLQVVASRRKLPTANS